MGRADVRKRKAETRYGDVREVAHLRAHDLSQAFDLSRHEREHHPERAHPERGDHEHRAVRKCAVPPGRASVVRFVRPVSRLGSVFNNSHECS